ncbi:MAG: c-type cytochrome [Cellvibrionaceae bacterium]
MKNIMNEKWFIFLAYTVLALNFSSAHAENSPAWVLIGEQSKVAYGSIKKNAVGEVNHFKKVSGKIDKTGNVSIAIDLSSVETYIGIRNERMVKYVFGEDNLTATLTAAIDLPKIHQLDIGDTMLMDVNGTLQYSDKSVEIETVMFIAKLSKHRFVATTDEMIMLKTEALGINSRVDKLMELAKLNSITRVAPVSLRLLFDGNKSQVSSAANTDSKQALSAGNIGAGKKLYRQCQACHQVKKPVNGVGPHLVNLLNRKAGSVEDFSYSKATQESGIVWTAATLDPFLANPQKSIAGNSMPFGGISKADDRKNLIAYLESLSKP